MKHKKDFSLSSRIDTRVLLPSEARRVITMRLLERLKAARLNSRLEPVYGLVQAWGEIHPEDEWGRKVVTDCFDEVLSKYEEEHPKRWNNKLQAAWREGIPSDDNDPGK